MDRAGAITHIAQRAAAKLWELGHTERNHGWLDRAATGMKTLCPPVFGIGTVAVGVAVAVRVAVGVWAAVAVNVAVNVAVGVGVWVAVRVAVGVKVAVRVTVGV